MKYDFLLLYVAFSCHSLPLFAQWIDPSPHQVHFVKVDSLVRLEVLDWGGKGEPLVFLSGLGNSAHIFDDFAPRFKDRFHVLAITRRGFGASSQPPSGYSIDTLTEDVLKALAALNLTKVTLVGHSIAGDELTLFAASYPSRVKKLVYLDAAHDRTYLGELFQNAPAPQMPPLTEADSASAAALIAYGQRVERIRYPEAEARATFMFDAQGKLAGYVTPGSIVSTIFKSVVSPAFKQIQVPALAIYAIPDSPQGLICYYNVLDSANRKKADKHFQVIAADIPKHIEKFRREVVKGKVVEIHGGHHYIFLSHPQEVERAMRQFLLSNAK